MNFLEWLQMLVASTVYEYHWPIAWLGPMWLTNLLLCIHQFHLKKQPLDGKFSGEFFFINTHKLRVM